MQVFVCQCQNAAHPPAGLFSIELSQNRIEDAGVVALADAASERIATLFAAHNLSCNYLHGGLTDMHTSAMCVCVNIGLTWQV
eukprot:400881-Amphidinium_carterae.1